MELSFKKRLQYFAITLAYGIGIVSAVLLTSDIPPERTEPFITQAQQMLQIHRYIG